ncbi:MAG: CBS domain-containing protein [Gemmatimonadota bacterium]|nr:CBS domain-containing protein [Gemmatimonadota bacterium]
MRIHDILRHKGHDVLTVGPEDTVHEAACILNRHRIGSLVVKDGDGEIAGIITERDILRECGERCTRLNEPGESKEEGCPVLVKDIMSEDVVIGVPGDDVNYIMGVMTKNRIRHLPIIDDGELTGIVSIGDVVNAHVEEADFENRMLKDYIQGVTSEVRQTV